jgi:hypothetical protein
VIGFEALEDDAKSLLQEIVDARQAAIAGEDSNEIANRLASIGSSLEDLGDDVQSLIEEIDSSDD